MDEHPIITGLRGGKAMNMAPALQTADYILACETEKQGELFSLLFSALGHGQKAVRVRAAYAAARVAEHRPELLLPHKTAIMDLLADAEQTHLVRVLLLRFLREFDFQGDERELVIDMLHDCLFSESSILKTDALEMLAGFAEEDEELRSSVMPLLWRALEGGTPAMRARARKLLKKYKIL